MLGGRAQVPVLPPEGNKVFQEPDDQSDRHIDSGLPRRVINNGFPDIVDKGILSASSTTLATIKPHRGRDEAGKLNAVLLQHKSFGEGEHVERHKEKNRRGYDFSNSSLITFRIFCMNIAS